MSRSNRVFIWFLSFQKWKYRKISGHHLGNQNNSKSVIWILQKWIFLWMSTCAWIYVKLDFIKNEETQSLRMKCRYVNFFWWYWTIVLETRHLSRLCVPRHIHSRQTQNPYFGYKCYFFLFSNKSMNYDNGLPEIYVSIGVLYFILFKIKDLILTRTVHNF